MDIHDEELLNFWNILNKNNVRYILAGDLATHLHCSKGGTDVVAMWLEDTLENRKNFRKAFIDLPFQDCYELASVAELEGVSVPFLHINHLIENKRAVNRPKDQIDISYLEKIREIRNSNNNP